jgi:hypothetical protein
MGNHNSGRYKTPEHIAKECRIQFERRADKLWEALLTKAESGSLEALIYVFDRQWGRPRQEIDARVRSTFTFSPDDLELASRTIGITIDNPDVKELPEAPPNEEAPQTNEIASE